MDLDRAILLTIRHRVPRSRPAPERWREVGNCRESDPNLFYPLGKGRAAREQAEEAKRVCRTCPSQKPCLAFALASVQELGVWGGTSPDERRLLVRARRAQVAS
jgi:WhiB family redox-sensing transcriptional regulator